MARLAAPMTNEGGQDPLSPMHPLSNADKARAMTRRALRSRVPARPIARTGDGTAAERRRIRPLWLGVFILPCVAGAIWLAVHVVSGAPPPRVAASQTAVTPPPDMAAGGQHPGRPPVAPAEDEAAILAAPADRLQVFRLKPARGVLVLVFPSLAAQGQALNRVGAFVEKSGAPHDRVLDDAEMARLLVSTHDTVESFYYGHDYRAADLRRFFATARRDGVALHPEENAMEAIVAREDAADPGMPAGAVISLPPLSEKAQIDAHARATILRHEVSHGLYFTDPAYAAYVQHFWEATLDAGGRERFRRLLGAEGYDVANDDLIRNEMQAYLVHTPDARFFNASEIGMTDAQAALLRHRFVAAMPPSWLRDRTPDIP